MSFVRPAASLVALVLCIVLASCDSAPTGPGTFAGHKLDATVNGTVMSFDVGGGLNNPDPSYDPADSAAEVFGAVTTGSTRRTLTVFFYTDINAGTFPRVIDRDDVNIVYIENIGGAITSYDCSTHRDDCSLTLTSSSGGVVSGSFTAHLTSVADTTRHAEIANGTFTVQFE